MASLRSWHRCTRFALSPSIHTHAHLPSGRCVAASSTLPYTHLKVPCHVEATSVSLCLALPLEVSLARITLETCMAAGAQCAGLCILQHGQVRACAEELQEGSRAAAWVHHSLEQPGRCIRESPRLGSGAACSHLKHLTMTMLTPHTGS